MENRPAIFLVLLDSTNCDLQHETREAVIADHQIAAATENKQRQPALQRLSNRRAHFGRGPRFGKVAGWTSDAQGRQRGQWNVFLKKHRLQSIRESIRQVIRCSAERYRESSDEPIELSGLKSKRRRNVPRTHADSD